MEFHSILDDYRRRVEDGLREFFRELMGPDELLAAMSYSLFAGGKRIRPVLLLATRAVFPPGGPDPMPAAAALEFVHTFSLIHDDLPAMDNDDFRRGVPTCHKKFGEAMAILAGDALLVDAFAILARHYQDAGGLMGCRVVAEIALAGGAPGMVGGQVLDLAATGRALDRGSLEQMHSLKTGALIRAAVRCGAILGAASESELAGLTRYSEHIGLAFQVVDDILDVVSSKEKLGKTPGKDRAQGKTTFVSLLGLEGAKSYAQALTAGAKETLAPFGARAETLRELADFIVIRTS